MRDLGGILLWVGFIGTALISLDNLERNSGALFGAILLTGAALYAGNRPAVPSAAESDGNEADSTIAAEEQN